MGKDWDLLQSKSIDLLRFPMAVAVVMLHHSIPLMADASSLVHALCILFQETLCRLSVPCFFFISGFLFFNHLQSWNWGIWKTKIRRRVVTLLLPYILWNIIAFFAYWGYASLFEEAVSFSSQFARSGGFKMFYNIQGGIPFGVRALVMDRPLWFIRDLLFYILATPVIFLFLRWTKVYGLGLMIMVHLLVQGIVPEGFVFFVVGSFLQLEGRNIVKMVWPWRKILYAISLVLIMILFYLNDHSLYWTRFFKVFFLFAGIGSCFCIASSLLEERRIQVHPFLVRSSFFIFALHEMLFPMMYARQIMHFIYPFQGGQVWEFIEYFLTPAKVIAICLAIQWLLECCMPRVADVLSGSRIKKA